MEPKERIQRAREVAGKTPAEVARDSEVSAPNIYDLEGYADEIYMAISIGDLQKVAAAIGQTVRMFFDAPGPTAISAIDLAEMVRRQLIERGESLEQFEDRAGWGLAGLLGEPESALKKMNVDCLRDVCRELGVDWTRSIPE